ncbi:MAG: tRNA pseudouridine(38-40) synthase TruA [Proteobacteria bacterium]|nr:tRNA pseudouridine(38-40) synthase TruA [Pseudomonadota bacterium]
MPAFRLVIEYDGTDFSGWQIQPRVRTVQGVLEQGLSVMLRKDIKIQGASRTDAGVHALGQVASFKSDTDIPLERLRRSLTALVRPDVSIVDAAIASEGFNARFNSTGKHYRYQILARPTPSPLIRHMATFVPQKLDLECMREAASRLTGQHDFAGFRAADCDRDTTVRELYEISITRDERDLVRVDVKGNAFLKNMVRIIAGTLIDVGKGRLSTETIDKVLETGDRKLAGPTAPALGLTLVEVFYPKE